MITAQRIAHGEFAAGATVVRVVFVSCCCRACSAPHCWRCRGAANMWRIRRQPDLVQCLGRPVWLAAQLGPLSAQLGCRVCPTVRMPRALAFGALFALRLCRAVRAALAASLCCCCCCMQRATCCLPLATCSLQAALLSHFCVCI